MDPRVVDIESSTGEHSLTRSEFLRLSAVTAGAIAFGGFTPVATAAARDRELDGFVQLSKLVTGVDRLPVSLAARYLEALDAAGLGMTPSRFVRLAGFTDRGAPETLAALQRSRAFAAPHGKQVAEAIAAAWWSGMVPTEGGRHAVITYEDALVWKALPYAEPPSLCLGATTAWSTPGRSLS
jgi:hypothetical protein